MSNSRKRMREDGGEDNAWKSKVEETYKKYILARSPRDEVWFAHSFVFTIGDLMTLARQIKEQDILFMMHPEKCILTMRAVDLEHPVVQRSKKNRESMVQLQKTSFFARVIAQHPKANIPHVLYSFSSVEGPPSVATTETKLVCNYICTNGILLSEFTEFDTRTNGTPLEMSVSPDVKLILQINHLV